MDGSPAVPCGTLTEAGLDFDAIVIGAGVSGLYQLYKLRELGLTGAGLRSRQRRRRHLVLEPLPRRPFRFRELDLRLLLFTGTAGRMGLGGALRGPARDRALSELRRRQVRSASRHPVQQPRHGRALPGGYAQLGRRSGGWPALQHAVSDHRRRRTLGGDDADHPRRRDVSKANPATHITGPRNRYASRASGSP